MFTYKIEMKYYFISKLHYYYHKISETKPYCYLSPNSWDKCSHTESESGQIGRIYYIAAGTEQILEAFKINLKYLQVGYKEIWLCWEQG